MSTTARVFVLCVTLAVASFLIYTSANADSIIYQQPDQSASLTTTGSKWVLPNGLEGFLTRIMFRGGASSVPSTGELQMTCMTTPNNLTQDICAADEFATTTISGISLAVGNNEIELDMSGYNIELLPARYYYFNFNTTSGGTPRLYGSTTTDQCVVGCDVNQGSPYMYVWASETQPSQIATTSRVTSQTMPTNGATAPSTAVTFQFSWFNSGYELYSVAQVEVSDVTNGYQYTPQQSNAALTGYGTTTQTYTLATNHLHLWRGCLLNPNTNQKTCSGYYSLNVVGPSASSSIPILPDIDDTNASSTIQSSLWGFLNVPQLLQTKLPFAYFFQVADLLNELQATTTEAVSPVVFDYSSLNISTTTKNALPARWEAFSTTTVTQYIPAPVLSAWRILMSSVIWFGFAMYVYHAIGRLFTGNTNTV